MNPTRDTSKGKLPFRFTKLQGLPPETNHHLNEAGTLQRHTQTLQSQTTHQKKNKWPCLRWVKQVLKCWPFDIGAHIKKIRNISIVGVCCWFCLLTFNAMSPTSSWSVVVHMIYTHTTTLHLYCTQYWQGSPTFWPINFWDISIHSWQQGLKKTKVTLTTSKN